MLGYLQARTWIPISLLSQIKALVDLHYPFPFPTSQYKYTHHWTIICTIDARYFIKCRMHVVVQSPASFGRVTCLPPKNVSAPWGGPGQRWLTVIVRQVGYIQYLLACKNSQRSTSHNIVKSAFLWSRVFRRRHIGRRVTAVTCLRWPIVNIRADSRFVPANERRRYLVTTSLIGWAQA